MKWRQSDDHSLAVDQVTLNRGNITWCCAGLRSKDLIARSCVHMIGLGMPVVPDVCLVGVNV